MVCRICHVGRTTSSHVVLNCRRGTCRMSSPCSQWLRHKAQMVDSGTCSNKTSHNRNVQVVQIQNIGGAGKKHKCRHRFTWAQNVHSTSIAKTRSTDENINSHGDFPKITGNRWLI